MAEAKAQVNAKAVEAAEKKKAKAAAAAEKKAGGESAPLPKGYVPRLKKNLSREDRARAPKGVRV